MFPCSFGGVLGIPKSKEAGMGVSKRPDVMGVIWRARGLEVGKAVVGIATGALVGKAAGDEVGNEG